SEQRGVLHSFPTRRSSDLELLIVVAIIGILAAIAIPNLLTAMQRARQKRSMADMRTIATAWESRATETNNYTAAAAGHALGGAVALSDLRSEERRVGEGRRSRRGGWN